MNDNVIHVERISKQYHIGKRQEKYKTLQDSLANALASPFRRAMKLLHGHASGASELNETIWALKDVSFEIKRGEVVGIIGRNGAGKSTLLKILSRISEPTSGFITIHGRVSSLLEVGIGFHPELTGRDNIVLNGAILGMKRVEIDKKFDDIVAFAEVEKFIDTPVKHYSSGMYLRLAFAVAAHLETEILLVDEVLAVGDTEFQKKCLGKIQNVAEEGRTVLFVSHDISTINRLCSRTIWIDSGQLRLDSLTNNVIQQYMLSQMQGCMSEIRFPSTHVNNKFQIKFIRIVSENNEPTAIVDFQNSFKIKIGYEVFEPLMGVFILSRITDLYGNIICTSWDTDTTDWEDRVREPDQYTSICTFPGCLLRPGRYLLSVGVAINRHILTYHENILSFEVSPANYCLNPGRVGIITPLFKWEVIHNGENINN